MARKSRPNSGARKAGVAPQGASTARQQPQPSRQAPTEGARVAGQRLGQPAGLVGGAADSITPYANLDHLLRVQAWGWTMPLDSVDTAAIDAFYHEHVNKGPEVIP